jgi:hypothetical protein
MAVSENLFDLKTHSVFVSQDELNKIRKLVKQQAAITNKLLPLLDKYNVDEVTLHLDVRVFTLWKGDKTEDFKLEE